MATGRRGNAQEACTSVRCGMGARSARIRARTIALLAVVLAFAAAAPASASPYDTLGVYAGSWDKGGIATFETRLGRKVAYAHDFLDKRSWTTMNDLAWVTQRARDAGFQNRIVLTVPMLPDTGGTLAQGAAGQYNAHFRKLAEQLVARGHPSAVLRLGPEFNGFWFPWTMSVPNGGALYAAYWRQIVATMRAVRGANFAFDWCPNAGSSYIDGTQQQLDAAAAWPGDDVVDYVGLDVYDQSWSPDRADPAARWNEFVNQKNGMAWHAAFAAAHGKPMTFPEWGLVERHDGMGGGDSPYFVEQMYRWIERHRVAYHLYFESHDPNAQYGVFSGRFPNAAARFVELFGARAVARGAGAAARSAPD
ncbi:MAG: glycoside hydrolase family 26 protein, partial [Solirubrobacteraceae bacterium]